MNWYSKLKLAQIWSIPSSGSFHDEIQRMYQLEYNRNQIMKSIPGDTFNGVPQRQENILKNIESELIKSIKEVRTYLLGTFKFWLNLHAYENPRVWAETHVHDKLMGAPQTFNAGWKENFDWSKTNSSPKATLKNLLTNYRRWIIRYSEDSDPEFIFKIFLSNVCGNINKFPSLKPLTAFFFKQEKNYCRNLLAEENGLDKFNKHIEFKLESYEQANHYIENMTIDDFDFCNTFVFTDIETFIEWTQYFNFVEFMVEVEENIVFPAWHNNVRGRIDLEGLVNKMKQVYNMLLQNKNDIGQSIADISIALNTAHSSGSMVEYLARYTQDFEIKNHLDSLTEGVDVPKWNDQLQEIGVRNA